MIRAVLAATLSSVYGIYSGFELCENAAAARPRRVSRFGEISVEGARLERAGKHQGLDHAPESDPAARIARCSFYDNLRFYPRRQRRDSLLRQDDAGARQHHLRRRESRSGPIATTFVIDVPMEEFGLDEGEDISGARFVN